MNVKGPLNLGKTKGQEMVFLVKRMMEVVQLFSLCSSHISLINDSFPNSRVILSN